ncbi:MAG: tcmH [Rhodospirillales bacterium]|nr:tcmH [Rhodospirillales bacterium]
MAVIRARAGVITQINVFSVPPGGQEGLTEAARCAREEHGWLSPSPEFGWHTGGELCPERNLSAAEAVIRRLKLAGFLDRNKAYGEAHPGLYEVVASFDR